MKPKTSVNHQAAATGRDRYTTGFVTSLDAATIGYRQLGQGPGVVLLHGAGSSGYNHMQLAEALSPDFTVYIPDFRGRGLSGPYGEDYSIQKEHTMQHVTSQDGTIIAFEKIGQGPAVVIVGGILGDHSQQAGLAQLLAEHFTVYNFDRRGRGESGFTPPYAVEREVEDIATMLDAAGGSALVYGTSGCGALSLEAAARGLSPRMKKLAVWEPPYIVDDSHPPIPRDYLDQLSRMLREGRRGDMLEYFFTQAIAMPAEFVAAMRQSPFWAAQEAFAPTLINEAILMDNGTFTLPKERIAKATVETLVIDGGTTPWLSHAADAVAHMLPKAKRSTIAGQPHNVADEAMAPVLIEFFTS